MNKIKENNITFYILTEGGSGMKFYNKEDFLEEISFLIEDCENQGGTEFDIEVTTN